jgi:predicted nucleic acid-binding protein
VLNTILLDAGPLIALFDKDDKYHKKVKEFILKKQYKFVSTTAVLTEVSHMLDFNLNAQIDFFEWIMSKGLILCEIQQQDIPRSEILGTTNSD